MDEKRWVKIEFENFDQKRKIDFSSMLSKWIFEKRVFLDRKWGVLLPKFPRKILKISEIHEVKEWFYKDAFCSLCHIPGNFAELKTQKVQNEGGIFQKASRLNFKIENFLFRKPCFRFHEVKGFSYEQNTSLFNMMSSKAYSQSPNFSCINNN